VKEKRIKVIIGICSLIVAFFVGSLSQTLILQHNERVTRYDIQRFETFREDILDNVLYDRYNCLYLYENDIVFLPCYTINSSKNWSTVVLMRGEFPSRNIKLCSELRAFLVFVDYSTGKYKVIFL